MDPTSRIIFMFLDGFGLGRAESENPMYVFEAFRHVLDVPVVHGISVCSDRCIAKGIDACMGVPGIPQSATGQTALFTGINAAKLLGYHLPAYPSGLLQEKIWESNIFKEAMRLGRSATFANAYRPEYFDLVASGKLQHSVTTHACLASRIAPRGVAAYQKSEAVFWDITGHNASRHSQAPIEEISPERAGSIIGALSRRYDLVVFESFLPDLIGHSRDTERAEAFCTILNRFTGTIIGELDQSTTLVVTSDHGNFEDLSIGTHTMNPVLLFAHGPDAARFFDATTIADIPGIILSVLAKC